ncbi:ubiquitin-ubiquitin ligase [Pichia kluyveri]|uniref:RING-type E3 ubiquitin transferase n=1 Tax=Pichia kluyveri TaxID=36015 RepID=A0AAV5R6X8_PICKL|nr:ubiquitin-ubiquitin ligase [Pichia kluyveri]
MASSQDEIRAMRLAKLEALNKKQKLGNNSTSKTNSETNTPKPSSSTNDDANTSLNSSLSPINTSQNTPVPASTSSSSSSSLGNTQEIDLGTWEASEIKRTLSVTLTPNEESKSLIFLRSLYEETGSTDFKLIDGPDAVLTSLIFEQGVTNHYSSPLKYLFHCWNNANISKLHLTKNKHATHDYDVKMTFYKEIMRLCSGYASILFYEPDTFIDSPNLSNVVEDLTKNINRYHDFFISILNAIVENQIELDFLNSFTPILTSQIDSSLDSNSINVSSNGTSSIYNNILLIVESLIYNKSICSYIHQMDFFNPSNITDPTQLEKDTFLGRILRISPLLSKLSADNYIGVINKKDVRSINESLSTTYSILINKLFLIIDSLVRINANSRAEILSFFSKLVNKNHLRMSEHVDEKKISSDSLMLNVSLILIKLSEPILREGQSSKIDKISIDFLNYSNKEVDLSEETRINSTKQECDEYYKDKLYDRDGKKLNFVSECFYLMLTYLQYGLGGVIVSYNKKKKHIKQIKEQITSMKQILEKGNQGNALAQRLVNMRLAPMEAKLKELQNDIYSIEMFFQARTFQLEVFDVIVGICEFLVRLIDSKHAYHPKIGSFFPYLQIPLNNFDNEVEKLDDIEYLRKLAPVPFKYYPEIYIEGLINYCHFISKFTNNPMIDNNVKLTKLIEFSVILLRCPELLSNPHLKARLTEVLFFGSLPMQSNNGEINGFMIGIFNDEETIQKNLLISLLDFYVMVEKTGASSQFYDKFNSRYHISFIIEKLWKFDIFKKDLRVIATKNQKFFIRFVARMLNDTTYLLDESLNHLHTIHNCQKELNLRSRGVKTDNEESDEDINKKLQESERMAKSFVQLSNKTILLFNLFTKETPKSFTIVEIVDRLAGMLNYNLVVLVGPRYNELKVKDPEKYQFDPKELLFQLCSIFINLSQCEEFIRAVARDLRSFNVDNIYKAINILKKSFKIPDSLFEGQLVEFAKKAESIKVADEEEELELGEAPDEFLDPLMYTLMKDPVKLPTSHISIDRSVLKAHLMNDPTDPFNRMPLKMEDVTDDDELREKIAAWIQSKRLQKRKQGDNDGDVAMS